MDKERRKELLEKAKLIKTYMGVYQVKNIETGKVFISSTTNLKNRWLTIRDQLVKGRFMNSALQKDWNEFGEEAFVYEVLEQKEVTEDINTKREVEKMQAEWLEKLQPYGDKGYNKKKD